MRADTETEVVSLLADAGYWDDPLAWRFLGDAENNFSSIGNQQSEAIAALVEKLINGVDARLIDACLAAGIDPTSADAPTSIREAVARFFEGCDTYRADRDGRIAEWTDEKSTAVGRLLTLAATGPRPDVGRPSISIADAGEGQSPDAFPDTFVSLMRSNKFRTHFVQGKFNMGGTGALNFCSEKHRFQLIVSRRNPAFVPAGASPRASEWGFTVVRRQAGEAGARSSVYAFLAPERSAGEGRVLSFAAESMPIFPEDPKEKDAGADAYVRHAPHGSLIKLYEYEWQGVKSNIVSSGSGLLRRIDLALPELALPIRLFECRPYGGGKASFSTNVLGLVTRLDRDRAGNVEEGFPVGANLVLEGKPMSIRVYAFKPDRADQYRLRHYGTVFSVNGQMHAAFPTDLFRRKAVNLSYVADSLLVVVDCSGVDEIMREDLFMNSRDRLRNTPLARRLEATLESYLREEPALRALQNRRREERTAERLTDDKPLADVLQSLLKSNPLLTRLFKHGLRLSAPFPPAAGVGTGTNSTFEGKRFPTYFRFKGHPSPEPFSRDAHLGSKARVAFETDAVDDYFIRETSPGAWRVREVNDGAMADAFEWTSTGPRTGVAQLTITLPEDAEVGSLLEYLIEVTDDGRTTAFANRLVLRVLPEAKPGGAGGGERARNTNRGTGGDGGGAPQLALPPIIPVAAEEWAKHGFDESTAVKVELSDTQESVEMYDFYVNVDNRYLRVAQKETKAEPEVLEKQFIYGMVLVGLSLIQEQNELMKRRRDDDSSALPTVEDVVSMTTRALAPIFLPMIDALGGLLLDDVS